MTRINRSALMLLASLFVLALLAAPSVSAALTITQVKVVVGGQEFCDTTTTCTGTQVWNLGGGVTLGGGETLILTQTGAIPGGGNFDTSDRFPAGPTCTSGSPCLVQIFINSGAGLTLVYQNAGSNPLNAGNSEPDPLPDPGFNEAAVWQTVCSSTPSCPSYTLDIGYADNEHLNACNATGTGGCFPQSPWGPAGATVFLGSPISAPNQGCGTTHPVSDDGGCYDAGALRITAKVPTTCPLTQGFWKTHPDVWPVTTLTIGSITYTEAQLLTILGTPVKGDASLILADQLIAALLNIANGSDPTPVSATIANAQSLLIGCNLNSGPGCKVAASSALGQQMVADASVLGSYNNGQLTPNCIGSD
jgi:hypothetical protein